MDSTASKSDIRLGLVAEDSRAELLHGVQGANRQEPQSEVGAVCRGDRSSVLSINITNPIFQINVWSLDGQSVEQRVKIYENGTVEGFPDRRLTIINYYLLRLTEIIDYFGHRVPTIQSGISSGNGSPVGTMPEKVSLSPDSSGSISTEYSTKNVTSLPSARSCG